MKAGLITDLHFSLFFGDQPASVLQGIYALLPAADHPAERIGIQIPDNSCLRTCCDQVLFTCFIIHADSAVRFSVQFK